MDAQFVCVSRFSIFIEISIYEYIYICIWITRQLFINLLYRQIVSFAILQDSLNININMDSKIDIDKDQDIRVGSIQNIFWVQV